MPNRIDVVDGYNNQNHKATNQIDDNLLNNLSVARVEMYVVHIKVYIHLNIIVAIMLVYIVH